ncbi:MAG: NADH-quinone oxidoreductase subunit J [Bryobacteraceae bacterium]|nr:NADH-quinone oxidoreductase subunit J [Bryobacteraceae bacterium]
MVDTLSFYIFALMALGGGVMTITRRNAVHSALWLIVSLLGAAGLFLLRGAEFLFAAQIVLYIGGVVLLILYVVMLVNLDETARARQFNKQWWIALACVAVVGAEIAFVMKRGLGALALPGVAAVAPTGEGNTERVADVLFSEYMLPFEIASLLLLVAVVGAVVMAKKRV